jgi:uncharacterized repeat protein (TIGR04138 family)
MPGAWTTVYATMHRDGAAAFPPACLHYVLELVRNEAHAAQAGTQGAPALLTPADTTLAFRRAARGDFGPLRDDVLEDWELRTPEDLGKAVTLLGRYGCLTLEDGDTPAAFATDTVSFLGANP